MDAVVLDHVDKAYTTYGTDIVLTGETRPSRTRQVLRDLSLTIPAGEITVIVGRSGCGKSTLLKLLAGTEMPDTGTIRIPEGWHSAMLSPDPYVITWTSVQRNVAMPAAWEKRRRSAMSAPANSCGWWAWRTTPT